MVQHAGMKQFSLLSFCLERDGGVAGSLMPQAAKQRPPEWHPDGGDSCGQRRLAPDAGN